MKSVFVYTSTRILSTLELERRKRICLMLLITFDRKNTWRPDASSICMASSFSDCMFPQRLACIPDSSRRPESITAARDRFLIKELWERRVWAPKALRGQGVGRGCPLPTWSRERTVTLPVIFQFWILNRRILVQIGYFLFSSPKAG